MSFPAMLERLETGLAWVNDRMMVGLKWLAIALLAIMLIIVDIAVFMRYVMNDALAWSEEIAKFVMVWLTFFVAPIGLRMGAHVGIEVILGQLRGRLRQFLIMMIFAGIIALMIVFIKEGAFMTWNARIQRASTIDISIFYVYICMPVGSFAVALVALEYMVNALRGVIDPANAKPTLTQQDAVRAD